MKTLKNLISIIFLLVLVQSCKNDEQPDESSPLIGSWKVVSTSGGLGGGGYTPLFDHLEIEDELHFKIKRNGEVLVNGRIELIEFNDLGFHVELIEEESFTSNAFYIMLDNEKIIDLTDTLLNLNSPCCDRYNTHFELDN